MKITIITLSDRAFKGEYEDLSGKIIEEIFSSFLKKAQINRVLIPDNKAMLLKVYNENLNSDFIITTGGTGISPKDITPEVTKKFCDKELPGISEIIRMESYQETSMAMLSRGYCGIKDKTIIINFPGSVKAVTLCSKIVLPIMKHAIKMMKGEGH